MQEVSKQGVFSAPTRTSHAVPPLLSGGLATDCPLPGVCCRLFLRHAHQLSKSLSLDCHDLQAHPARLRDCNLVTDHEYKMKIILTTCLTSIYCSFIPSARLGPIVFNPCGVVDGQQDRRFCKTNPSSRILGPVRIDFTCIQLGNWQ